MVPYRRPGTNERPELLETGVWYGGLSRQKLYHMCQVVGREKEACLRSDFRFSGGPHDVESEY